MNFESKTIKELETIVGDIPDEIDYRTKGAVNEIKDQKHCGSCWAFGSCAAMESSWFLKHGTLYSLSEQCLVDCCHDCLGCHGCLPSLAFEYVKIFMHGLFETEDNYPYQAEHHSCKFDKTRGVGKLTGYHKCKSNEDQLKTEVAANGPYAVMINADSEQFRLYSSGVFDNPKCGKIILDHVVTVIGYGVEDGKDYWLVRNSWGKYWGLEGYIKMSRNKDNQCGIATEAVIPLID
ncbi:Clan CA, family C1, cathepsin L-like cysteine peptidase [Trichomonas vaginalis G3]|uniref:Clan CA, family C1, cathepsin L-like cysteine peptidase n=1 Tax=Trichomonas vaginalis (strain ATCC PRA-98 / G3) TaxID=412133 RepID=A2GD33_TRIV3|nr:cysteine-type peptidase protein [Trichomonas vaginalis G3]EAX84935.1 Clan CA, family C1, cathepsin L-like cysteine peptidase [Trichomonas vaginalis G3]KAI5514432.1 cysteine-type peptidase protein [Trichomonas vaginalis G3]|eukprot:XP_001297865.1 Clan CA, family C1, cathepsin L-like cysteine peptidase [Trichomonas vaginalis G3]